MSATAAASLAQSLRAQLAAMDHQLAAARHTADAIALLVLEAEGGVEPAPSASAEEPPLRFLGDDD